MKYGVLFSVLSLLVVLCAILFGGWFLILLWPGFSFGVLGMGYLTLGHRVFGKLPDGSMHSVSVVVLLPYLLCLWGVWHLVRLISREPAYDELADGVLIGRRLLTHEVPSGTQTVVDLTSEFPESSGLRSVPNYVAVPMLAASILPPQILADLVTHLATMDTPIFIHCAQGHGRTALISALFLVARGDVSDPDAALKLIQGSRPLAGLNHLQRSAMIDAASLVPSITQ
ncbi:hypothetical protein CA13_24760 [Planctomycetes bacterium CA13]|uniref:Tyrosine specific protein phosphatases domain-containing protein n=1 Tax=Novipirellula herctigrandis TaxID=2527986 RepID=A0A5C5Z156_9BACT|nr:hypothetical protein CA13_24760 [Planctomycetes bacterium CA13]